MIYLGTDIVEVRRIGDLIAQWPDRFTDRVFTSGEIEYCNRQANPAIHYAGRFAAKEAARKAYSAAGQKYVIPFVEIDIRRTKKGVPSLVIANLSHYNTALSISHTESYATATVILQTDE